MTTEDGSARIRPFLGVPPSGSADRPAPGAPAPRPFVLTSGRVLGDESDIGLESQVTTRFDGAGRPPARLTPEQQAIVALCAEPVSIAEISARLRLHLDVTRILVDDLRAAGYLDVHSVGPVDRDTIVRVIHGLRALS
ncbi:MAG: hypothetical protein AUI14_05335 [Actinobacteria bacterium 13_2_20CM_2_71_6]|nr:MAG: hypothetical protein AUI14_05335 [Actinobacteria bacterium 13_2_20CM_2_71_6]